jgi:hypothetical protein
MPPAGEDTRREPARGRGHRAGRPEARARGRLGDSRGFLARLFCADELPTRLEGPVAQSTTPDRERGSVRGLHFQHPPHAEKKLVQCLRGEVWTSPSTCGAARRPFCAGTLSA